jgi:hypothetical protein
VIQHYDDCFFDRVGEGAYASASIVAPIVIQMLRPSNVVDFGCGRGTWLKVFSENGVGEVLGLDGAYVDRSKILISAEEFRGANLEKAVDLGRRFDLATCLEVAEHLPTRASQTLVLTLVKAAPVVLFSAAVPGQGGMHHVNEQWPEFWDRAFGRSGYLRFDWIRPQIWQDKRVKWWYRQNLYLYMAQSTADNLVNSGRVHVHELDPELELIGRDVIDHYKSLRGLVRMTGEAGLRALRSWSARVTAGG